LRGALNVCRRDLAAEGRMADCRNDLQKQIAHWESISTELNCVGVSE
jgi:hypothetical protein